MRFLTLSVIVLELGVLAGCAAGGEVPVERVEKVDADSVEEVPPEESTGTPSKTTTPSDARSEQANASPEEVQAIREQDRAQGGQGISITQTGAPDPAPVGQPLTFDISVTNRSIPQRVGFKDFLPPSMTLVSATPSQGTCGTSEHGGNEVGCTLGVVPNGDLPTIEVVATPTAPGSITNTAVGLAEFTPATSANTNVATITVNPAP